MGLTGSVSYLLPLLFPAKILSAEMLRSAREAIQQRQNVVHGGAREVHPDELQRFLRSLREFCDILGQCTKE